MERGLLIGLAKAPRGHSPDDGLAAGGELSPLQRAFLAHGGVQCGFCTPGMLISATALLARNPRPDDEEIKASLSGNLCRCTGYTPILAAVRSAAEMSAG